MTIGHHPSEGDSGISPLGLIGHFSDSCPERKGPSVGVRTGLDMNPSGQGLFCPSPCFVEVVEESQHHLPCGAVTGKQLKESWGEWTLRFPFL